MRRGGDDYSGRPMTFSENQQTAALWGHRENDEMREGAHRALTAYAESLRFWGATDALIRKRLSSLVDEVAV